MEELLLQDKPYIEYLDGNAYPRVAVLMLERLRSLPESERKQPPFTPVVAVRARPWFDQREPRALGSR